MRRFAFMVRQKVMLCFRIRKSKKEKNVNINSKKSFDFAAPSK